MCVSARECVFFAVSLVKFLALFCTYFQQFVPCVCVGEWVRCCVSICFNRLRCAQCACVCVCVDSAATSGRWICKYPAALAFTGVYRMLWGRTGFSDLLFYCGLSACVCA